MVDGNDSDGLAIVFELPAGTALGGVPAFDGFSTANPGEPRDLALGLPAVSSNQAVGTVGARDGCEGARAIIIASVIRDCEICKYMLNHKEDVLWLD